MMTEERFQIGSGLKYQWGIGPTSRHMELGPTSVTWNFNGVAISIDSNGLPGASVSFTQSGAGAATRTLQDKAREWVSPADFSAGTIQAAINAAGASGSVLIPANYAGADDYTNTDNIPIIDLRNDQLGVWSVVGPSFPIDNYPQGADLVLRARGSADKYLEQLKVYATTTTTLSVGANASVTVGTVSVGNGTRGAVQTGTTALLSEAAGIWVGRETANEEVVPQGSWSIVDGTHLSITCANTHGPGTTDIEQFGCAILSEGGIILNSDALNPSQNSTRSAPLRVYDSQINPIVYLPADLGDTWPYAAVRWQATLTGAQGANTDLVLRNSVAAAVLKLLNAANTETVFQVNDNGDLVMAGGIQTVGPATLPAAFTAPLISWENPVTRIYFGTGAGYELHFCKRTGSVTTTQATLTDSGSLTLLGALTHGSATLIFTTATLSDHAGAGGGTLTNAPTAGNPTKWIKIDDNGTARYIPTWT